MPIGLQRITYCAFAGYPVVFLYWLSLFFNTESPTTLSPPPTNWPISNYVAFHPDCYLGLYRNLDEAIDLTNTGQFCDEYDRDHYERAFDHNSNIYFPELDITQIGAGWDEEWFYFMIDLYGTDDQDTLSGQYGIEWDTDWDNRGDYLIIIEGGAGPAAYSGWTQENIELYTDSNNDIGGADPLAPTDRNGGGNRGYDQQLWQTGDGDEIWSRVSPSDSTVLEIAIKKNYVGNPSYGTMRGWSWMGSSDLSRLYLHDHRNNNQLGDAYPSWTFFPPNLQQVDNTDGVGSWWNPPIRLDAELTSPTCYGDTDGTIDLQVNGGKPPFSYQWSNGTTNEDLAAVASGKYMVIVTDDLGNVDSLGIQLEQPDSMLLSGSITPVSSFGGTEGAIDLNVSGGTSPYTYQWSNGASTQDINNLVAGVYRVTVTDALGCRSRFRGRVVQLIPSGNIQKFVSIDTVESGRNFLYNLRYSCAGTTGNCEDVVIRDTLPASVEFISFIDNPVHSSNTYYNASCHCVTFELNRETGSGLLSGSTGEVSINVRFPNGTTPDETAALNQAFMSSSNAVPGVSNSVETVSDAEESWEVNKSLYNASAIYQDVDVTFEISLQDISYGSYGGLNLSNVRLVDTLPPGAVFVSANNGGIYNAPSGTVSWNLGNLNIISGNNQYQRFEVTLNFPSSTFAENQSIKNKVVGIGTPPGAPEQLIGQDSVVTTIGLSVPSASLTKRFSSSSSLQPNDPVSFDIILQNNGTTNLDNLVLIDTISSLMELTAINTGRYSGAPHSINISYQTNLQTSWQSWTGSPFTGSTDQQLYVSGLGLGGAEYVTMVRYELGNVAPGFSNTSGADDIDIIGIIRDSLPDGTPVVGGESLQNCANLSYVFNSSSNNLRDCVSTIINAPTPPSLVLDKASIDRNVLPESPISYRLFARIQGDFPLNNFILLDTIPAQMDFTSARTGIWSNAPATNLIVRYKTNLNSTWQVWPGSPFDGSSNQVLNETALSLAANEYVDILQWDFGNVPIDFAPNGSQPRIFGNLLTTDRNGLSVMQGDTVFNCGYLSADFGVIPLDRVDCDYIVIDSLDRPEIYLSKSADDGTLIPGDPMGYTFNLGSRGDYPIDSFIFIDTLPDQMDFTSLQTGTWNNAPSTDLTIRYQTNLNSSWQDWPGSPFNGSSNQTLDRSALSLAANEYVSLLMWDFGTVPLDFASNGSPLRIFGDLLATDRNGTTVSAGDRFSNCANLRGEVGTIDLAERACAEINVVNPSPPSVNTWKSRNQFNTRIFQDFNYVMYAENTGGYPLDNFYMLDTIPVQMEFISTEAGTWNNAPSTNLNVRYQTNLNNSWQDWPGGPFDGSTDVQLYASALGLAAGERVTIVRWDFGTVPAGFTHTGNRPRIYGSLLETDYDGLPVSAGDLVNNCVHVGGEYNGTVYTDQSCSSTNVINPDLESDPVKWIINSSGGWVNNDGPYAPGDTVDFVVRLNNHGSSDTDLPNPIAMDLLPTELSYVPGSWRFQNNGIGAPNPIFEALENYNTTDRTLLRWSWTGASAFSLPRGSTVTLRFEAVVNSNVYANAIVSNRFHQTSESPYHTCNERGEVDINDLDGDGSTTDILCHDNNDATLTIVTIASLQSEKLVKGQLDSVYTKFPAVGSTVPGGIADYRLYLRNVGTVPMSDIIMIDILPHVNDTGVVNLAPRYSRWRPVLVAEVEAPPGVTVYYSTSKNPCRDSEGFVSSGPAGCQAPVWSTSLPADISTVQSLKFDFGTNTLNPGEAFVIDWPMRAPVNTLDELGVEPDSIAWNSFGYLATRTDNGVTLLPSEPVKVGIQIDQLIPAVYGDLVWLDINENGLQDVGEQGIDGVRVELYRDNGDGLTNPAIDTFVNFTLTNSGGYYLFSFLPPGDYYTVFHKPPAYELSLSDQGSDDFIDSDGTPTTLNGINVAITPIVTLGPLTYDLSWDQGLYPSSNAALGNYVWNDVNNDGLQNESSADGINGIQVNLYEQSNPSSIYQSDITDNDINGNPGYYLFDNVPPGNYFVEFILPASTSFTSRGSTGSNDPFDSDPDISSGRTEVFTLTNGIYDNSWDAGLRLENCYDGIDNDGDGLADCDDPNCQVTASFTAPTLACVFDTIRFVAVDQGIGVNYTWDFGPGAQPSTATGIGPHAVQFVTCSDHTIELRVSRGSCTDVQQLTLSTQDLIAPTFAGMGRDTTIDCQEPAPVLVTPVISDNCDTSLTVDFVQFKYALNPAGRIAGCSYAPQIREIQCNDQGTVAPGDDTYRFELIVNGSGPGGSWTGTIGGNTYGGTYGTAVVIGPLSASTTSFMIEDIAESTCRLRIELQQFCTPAP